MTKHMAVPLGGVAGQLQASEPRYMHVLYEKEDALQGFKKQNSGFLWETKSKKPTCKLTDGVISMQSVDKCRCTLQFTLSA
jgi:hypothetical protein